MKILVTGCDGLLGNNLVRELLSRKYQVRAFIFKPAYNNSLDDLDIEMVFGNILNENDMLKATKGCDAVIHAAASTDVWPARKQMIRDVNIIGTQNVVESAKANGLKRIIHVSSANSFGFGSKEKPGNEDTPYKSGKYGLDYLDSKHEAQNYMFAEIKKGLPAIIVNPCFMIGPLDHKPSSGEMLVSFYKGKVPAFSPGGKNFVYVKDAAVAIANALTMGRIGEAYILGHENLTYKEFLLTAAKVMGNKPPKITAPGFLIQILGAMNSLVAAMLKKAPSISFPMAWIACHGHYFSPAKAVKELEMPQTPIEDAIKEAFEWFVEHGYIQQEK